MFFVTSREERNTIAARGYRRVRAIGWLAVEAHDTGTSVIQKNAPSKQALTFAFLGKTLDLMETGRCLKDGSFDLFVPAAARALATKGKSVVLGFGTTCG